MLKVGLTGGIGSGKSLVARMFGVLGVPVFEADAAGRQLLAEDPAVRTAILERFGEAVLHEGRVDRKALAAVVFQDPQALADLNAIVHPAVRQAFRHWAEQQNAPYVLMEAAILAETGGHKAFDRVVVVSAPEPVRLKRVMVRDRVTEAEVKARMRNQASEEDRLAIADHIIVNNDQQLVIPQVLQVHQVLSHAS
jgi:dephospho-CoA kinase